NVTGVQTCALPIYTLRKDDIPQPAGAGDRLRRMEDALWTTGVARRRPAADPEQMGRGADRADARPAGGAGRPRPGAHVRQGLERKSTRLNSSHVSISYAVFCLKKK